MLSPELTEAYRRAIREIPDENSPQVICRNGSQRRQSYDGKKAPGSPEKCAQKMARQEKEHLTQRSGFAGERNLWRRSWILRPAVSNSIFDRSTIMNHDAHHGCQPRTTLLP
jgi:hypothetical protein